MGKKNYDELAGKIIEFAGGRENVSFCTHCVTRLRFVTKDKSMVQTENMADLKEVLGTQWVGDQFQVIIGNAVEPVYKAVCAVGGFKEEEAINENLDEVEKDRSIKGIILGFLETLSSILAPIIPAICGCGLIQGLLYSVSSFGIVDESSMIYTFFLTIANTAFYFLPMIVAFSAGKRFKCNPYIAAVLGGIMIHPSFVGLAGTSFKLFDLIPITFADYNSTIVPAIICVYFMAVLEKQLKKIIPNMLDLIVTPLVELVIAAVVGLALLAPLGNWIGMGVVNGFMWLYNTTGPIGAALFSACYPFILATGMQVAEVPVIMQNIATLGYDLLYPCEAATNAAMAAAALYIFIKARNAKNKSLGGSTGVTALIGVTEPVLFGLVFKFKQVLYAVIAGGAVGGFIMGLFKVQYLSFGFVPFGTIILAMTETFPFYLLGVFSAMIVTVIVLHFTKGEY